MQITVKCPGCDAALPVSVREGDAAIDCGGCRLRIPLHLTAAVLEDEEVDACPVCEGKDFYGRKDFNPQLGLTVVVIGAVISAAFYWYDRDLIAYGILGGAVIIDLVVARWLGEVTVCYRCHAEFRGAYQQTAGAFDLHLADVFEQEYERKIGRR